MGFRKAFPLSLLLVCCGSVTSLAIEPAVQKSDRHACFSMDSLAASLATDGLGLSITHLIKGADVKPWVEEVGRKTGIPFTADEVATIEGRTIAPLIMLVFASGGCAHDVVTLRIVPDIEV